MPQLGVQYEDVARVASELRARGLEVSNRAVLAETRGSAATVHKHLKRWHGENPSAAALPPELPAGLLRAIQEELVRLQASARADLQARLSSAHTELEDVANESERRLAELETQQAQLVELTAERDRLQGQAEQQATDLQRAQRQIEEERRAAENSRVELAKARLQAEAQTSLAEALRNERDNSRSVIESERQGRIHAERELAGAQAARDTLIQRVDELLKRAESVSREREQQQQQLDAERSARSTVEKALATSLAEAKAASARADDLQRREELIQAELKQREDALRRLARSSSTSPTTGQETST